MAIIVCNMKLKNKERHLQRLRQIHHSFSIRKLFKIAKWTEWLIQNIEKENPSDYKRDWSDFWRAYQQDMKIRDPFFSNVMKKL